MHLCLTGVLVVSGGPDNVENVVVTVAFEDGYLPVWVGECEVVEPGCGTVALVCSV